MPPTSAGVLERGMVQQLRVRDARGAAVAFFPPGAQGGNALARELHRGFQQQCPLIITIIVTEVVMWASGLTWNLGSLFEREVQSELSKYPAARAGPDLRTDLSSLPAPVRRFLRRVGWDGRSETTNARIEWQEMFLKRSPSSAWMPLACEQFNSVPEPTRIAFMKTRLGGVLPFEGRDKFQDGHGNMRIRLGHLLRVGDSSGPEMDASGLVTTLAELPLVPAYAVQPYVRWEAVDDRSARAHLTFGGKSVSGTFYFNEADEIVRFDSDDRWQDGRPPRRMPWSAQFGAYHDEGGLAFPTEVSATWHQEDGEFDYVRGTIASIAFNVRK